MDKKLTTTVMVIVVIGVGLVSWQLGYKSGLGRAGFPPGVVGSIPQPSEMRSISGVVEKVGTSDITIKVSSQPSDSRKNLSSRLVLTDQNTIMERFVQKDAETRNREQAAFAEKMKNAQKNAGTSSPAALPLPPDPFIREKISLKDIKTGDSVIVISDKDISTESSFMAINISVQVISNPVAPAGVF